MLLYFVRLLPNWKAKEIVIRYFFSNTSTEEFKRKCDQFSEKIIPTIIRSNALKELLDHKRRDHKVIVVTASVENWLIEWCRKYEVELIGTRLEIIEETITGKLYGKNCYGPEKVRRIREQYDLEDFDSIYAYGDSRGDKELLDIATHPHYRYF